MILNDIEKVKKILKTMTDDELLPYIKETKMNGIMCKVKENNELEILDLDNREKAKEKNPELYNWFKIRRFYEGIYNDSSNYCIKIKKLKSVTPYSLIFNYSNDKVKIEKDKLIIEIKSKVWRDIRSQEPIPVKNPKPLNFISTLSSLSKVDLEIVEKNIDKLILAVNKLKSINSEIFKKEKLTISLFLDEPVEKFKRSYKNYIKYKCFGDTTCLYGNEIYGTMCNQNSSKPTVVDNRRMFPYIISSDFNYITELSKNINIKKLEEDLEKKGLLKNKSVYKNKTYVYTKISNLKIGKPQIITRLEFKSKVEKVNALSKDKKILDSEKGHHKRKNQYNMLKRWFNNYIKDVDIDIADNLLDFLVNLIMDNIVYEKKKINGKEVWEYNEETFWDLNKILSIKDYINQEGGEFKMLKIIENIKNDIREGRDIKIENDIQAAYLFGQTSQYLVYHSEAEDKRGGAFEGVRIENFDLIKEKIFEQYSKYSYKLSYSPDNILNKLVYALMGYESKVGNKLLPKQIKTDRKLAYLNGAISSNIISEINKENSKNNKEMKDEVK